METPHRQALEALLFVAEEPLEVPALAELLDREEDDLATDLAALAELYEDEERGLAIREVAGGWRMYTAPVAYEYVERYALAGKSGRLTQAALETLAVIAYKQPISRQEIGDIRGVNADGAVRSLLTRGYVEEVGRDEGPGQAILYGTSARFLEKLGLDSLDQLPPLTEFLPEAPAPDEPELEHLKEARRVLASGEALPTTGRGRWSPLADRDTNTGDDDDPADAAMPAMRARVDRSGDEDEMDDLTDRLEEAARSAMAQLKSAVAATEDEAEDGDEA